MGKAENILIGAGIIAVLVPLVLQGVTTSMINKVENLEEPEAPEIDNLADLYKLDSFEADLTTFIYFTVADIFFQVFTGRTILEGLKHLQFILFVILIIEGIIIGLIIIYIIRSG